MMNLLTYPRQLLLVLSIFLSANFAYAEAPKNDAQTIEQIAKFTDEGTKLREDHIQQMRELHLKHVNDMYDRKLAHNKEMAAMWKQMKPGDKAGNQVLAEQIKNKHQAFEKEDEKIKEDFKENVLKKKNKEFRDFMDNRHKEMKSKFKD